MGTDAVITGGDEGTSGVLVDGNEKRHQYPSSGPNVPDWALEGKSVMCCSLGETIEGRTVVCKGRLSVV